MLSFLILQLPERLYYLSYSPVCFYNKKTLEPGTRNQEPKAKNQEPGRGDVCQFLTKFKV